MAEPAASHPAAAPPFRGRFEYSRAELLADGIVHAVGIVAAISAGSILLAFAFARTGAGEYAAAIFYVLSLLTVLCVSCAYNLWPASPVKWMLRRFDHAAIYLLIAGTYTPILAQLEGASAHAMLSLVWICAAVGIALKLFLPGRFDRLAVVFYLAIGWSGVAVAGDLAHILPSSTITLVAAGGMVYSAGVVFYAWSGLKFQSAIWHGFVVAGAGLHLGAMMDMLVIGRI